MSDDDDFDPDSPAPANRVRPTLPPLPPLPPLPHRPQGMPPLSIQEPAPPMPAAYEPAYHPPAYAPATYAPPDHHEDDPDADSYHDGAAHDDPAGGPVFTSPRDLERGPLRTPGHGWVMWVVPCLVLLAAAVGVVTFLAQRGGPAPASAGGVDLIPPLPDLPPEPVAKRSTVKVAPRVFKPVGINSTGLGSIERKPKPPVKTVPVNAVPLPHPGELDRLLRDMERLAAARGLAFKPAETLRAINDGPSTVQPVELKIEGTFRQTVAFLQDLRARFPAALLDSFDISPVRTAPSDTPRLRTWLTVNWHLQKEDRAAGEILMPTGLTDVVGSLVDVARMTEGQFAVVAMYVAVDGAADAPGKPLKPVVNVHALGQSDAQIEELVGQLGQGPGSPFANVSLIITETMQVGDRSVRKFTLKYRVPEGKREGDPENRPVPEADIPDPFRAPAWLRPPQTPRRGGGSAR